MSEDYNFLRSFTFNEKETKHLFQISQVRLPFLSKDNEYLKIGNADGKYYTGSTLGDLTISIDGFIIKDNSKMSVSDTIDELIKTVNSDKPKRIVLDALSDRYFMGIFSGMHEYDATNLNYTPLTLNFDVPESFARAISIDGYSNIKYDVEDNLMLDSEFENTAKFWKPFAYKIDETFVSDGVKRAWSWSADGIDRFTTEYPNDNLIVRKGEIKDKYVGSDGKPESNANCCIMLETIPVKTNEVINFQKTDSTEFYRCNWLTSDGKFHSRFARNEDGFGMVVPVGVTLLQVSYPKNSNNKIEKSTRRTIYTPSPKDDYANAYPKYEGYYSSNNSSQSTNPRDYEWFPVGTPTNYSSNILQADFRTGYPVGATDHLTYLQVTPNSRRFINGIKVGDKVAISTFYRFKQLGVDLSDKPNDYVVATIHLDEWGGTPLRIQYTHSVDVKKSDVILNTFKQIGGIFSITSDKTTHINLTVGFAGLSLFEMSKPMFVYKTDKQNISKITYVKSNNTLTDNITVINNGTYKTPLLAEFTMNGESGFVGLINVENGGVLQFGDVEDVDGIEATKSENVVNLTFNGNGPTGFEQINSGFNTIYKRMVGTKKENLFTGSFDTKSIYYSAKPTYSNEHQPSDSWNGPSGVVRVKSPSSANRGQNFGFFLRGHFDDGGKVNQRGRLECSIMDNTDNPYLNLLVRNSSNKSNTIVIEGFYKGTRVWEKTLLRKDVKTTRFELSIVKRDTYVRYYVSEIKQLGPNNVGTQGVTSKYKNHNFTYNLTEVDETPVYSIGVWCMRYSNSTAMEKMLLDDLQFRWYNSPNWTNVKNSFQDGDIVSVDVDSRLLFVNGVVNSELNAVGNEWDKFYIGLGKSTIQPVVSSWANRPLVNINVQNRFI